MNAIAREPAVAEISVRRPLERDWAQILEILETANFHNIGGKEMPEFPLADCFIAVAGDRVVGVCGYKILDAETAKNTLTAVAPDYRGNGIATNLKRVCVDYLRRHGIKTLFTNCDDPKVIEWNIKTFGFRPTGKIIPKVESYGRLDVDHWINLVATL